MPQIQKQEKKEKAVVETAKCPECFKRFRIDELPVHMKNDHFMDYMDEGGEEVKFME